MPKKSFVKTYSVSYKPPFFVFVFILCLFLVLFSGSPYANTNPVWSEPQLLESANGMLDTSLLAQNTKVRIGTTEKDSNTYNGAFSAPTWKIKGGDTVKVNITNNLDTITNLHFHGGHISPKGKSDNVFIAIAPDTSFTYEYHIPVNHPPGLYWYHPHAHPFTEEQVMGGMAGAIIVKGNIDELPGIKGVPEKLLVLQTQDGDNPNNPERLVNGKKMPTIYLRPGETQRWRILNASADDFFNFAIPGYTLHIISRDGNTLDRVVQKESELLSPGDRIEILIRGGMPGEYQIKSLPFNEGFAHYVEDSFMRLKVEGIPMFPKPLPTTLLPFNDLRNVKIDKKRVLTFGVEGPADMPVFLIDGKPFDPNIINQTITLGTTEEWVLENKSKENHPFHIHINPFQVVAINGKPVESHGYDDTFSIPPHSTLTIRTKYTDFDGKFVLHCHILFHEDHGMMQIVEIVKPGATNAPHNGLPAMEHRMNYAPNHETHRRH